MAAAGAGVRSPHNVTPILERIVALDPERVLDVGAGYGMWGMLLREHLDDFVGYRKIDGVEPDRVRANRSPAHQVYDLMLTVDFPGPMAGALADRYDLVLMDGYLDRLTPADGYQAIRTALKLAPLLLVSVRRSSDWADVLEEHGIWMRFSSEEFLRCVVRRDA